MTVVDNRPFLLHFQWLYGRPRIALRLSSAQDMGDNSPRDGSRRSL